MVRAAYERPLGDQPGEGGRVTELTARPALALLFPTLGHLRQPLAGEVAMQRTALEHVPFVDGYGVDVGLLLDIAARYGADSIGEVSIAARAHRNRPMHQLKPMALEVLRVILNRAGVPTPGPAPHERPAISGDSTVRFDGHA
jgi:glucosyl-3-phosphoglycerate synthase